MIPTSIRLRNWCQHKDLEVELPQGMVMIRGPNGSGKSNLIDAMCLACSAESNNVKKRGDKKTDNITVGEESAAVYLSFEHEGKNGLITLKLKRNYRTDADVLGREISYAKTQVAASSGDVDALDDEILRLVNFTPRESVSMRLEWGDKGDPDRVVLSKQTEVLEWISGKIGLPSSAIRGTFFPTQGSVDDLISGDPEARYRSLAEQAGIVICSTVHRLLGEEINAQPSFDGVEEQLREARSLLNVSEKEVDTLEERFKEAKEKAVDPEPLRSIISAYQQSTEARKTISDNISKKSVLATELEDKRQEVKLLEERGKTLKVEFDRVESKQEEARECLNLHEKQQSDIRRREQVSEALTSAIKTKESLPTEPVRPVDDENLLEKLNKDLPAISQQIKDRKEWLSKFESGVCPTCKRPIGESSEVISGYASELADLEARQKEMAPEILRCRTVVEKYRTDHTSWSEQRSRALSRIETLSQQLETLPEIAEGDLVTGTQMEAARDLMDQHKKLRESLDRLRSEYSKAAKEYRTVETDLAVVESLIKAAKGQSDKGPTEEQFKEASDKFSKYQLAEQELRDAEREFTKASGVKSARDEEVERLEKRFSCLEPVREWLGVLGQVRDCFHKNGLPRDAVLWYANRLIGQTNVYLDEFDERFSMSMGDDMSLLAVFEDSKIQPASRLSDGEKNMLNLSLRFAYADLYPSAFKFLELDEVEVHLDQENVERLPAIFEKVKGLARNRGLVVLFISHHPTLGEIADHVIDL